MIILVCVVLSIPVGYLLGGKIANIKHYNTRGLGLPIAAFLLEAVAPYLRDWMPLPVAQWHWALVIVEYTLLFSFCLVNRKAAASWIIFAACLLNFIAIASFGFQMPVTPHAKEIPAMAETLMRIESGEYFRYTVASTTDPFWFLGDVIMIPLKRFGGSASIGDVLLGIGCGFLFCSWMLTKPAAEQQKTPKQQLKKDDGALQGLHKP